MQDWKSQFAQQKRDFIQKTTERLMDMRSMLEALKRNPSDQNTLGRLHQHFHQLSGSSAIYEMDSLGEIALQGEKFTGKLMQMEQPFQPDCHGKVIELIEAMQLCLAQGAAGGGAGPSAAALSSQGAQGQNAAQNQALTISQVFNLKNVTGQQQKPRDILIVDGDQTALHNMSRILEEMGMEVRGYRTVSGGKKAVHERLPDAMILCLPLSDGPGYDVAGELRTLPDGNTPPVIIVSRQAGFLDRVTAIRSGADAFFDEETSPETVIKRLEDLLERDKPDYTILSVEDDPEQASYIREVLESVGYTVHSIGDPNLFEETLAATNPDLLLLDVMLGSVSGFELARFVRADDRYAATPIIFLTTQNQLNAHVESARVGGDEHLIKPVAPQLLIAAVAGRLERYRTLKRLIGRDGLTNCLTMSSFMEEAPKLFSKRYTSSLVLLLVDVDHIEKINETYGFAAGDRVVQKLGELLKQSMRNATMIARFGGDDFAVVVSDIDDRELADVATHIVQQFEGLVHSAGGRTFTATVSAGAAALEPDMDMKAWLSNAQVALKSAKSQGRNRVLKAKTKNSTAYRR